MPPPVVTTIEATLTAEGDVADFAEGTAANSACRSNFASVIGVEVESVGLLVTGGSVQLTFVVVTSGESSEAAVVDSIEAALGTDDAASEALAIPVTRCIARKRSGISDDALAAGLTKPAALHPRVHPDGKRRVRMHPPLAPSTAPPSPFSPPPSPTSAEASSAFSLALVLPMLGLGAGLLLAAVLGCMCLRSGSAKPKAPTVEGARTPLAEATVGKSVYAMTGSI